MSMHAYYPEMQQVAPVVVNSHASLSHYGEHYFLRSTVGPDQIKGRGIKYLGQLTAERMVPGSKFVGYHEYKVTVAAMDKLEKTLEIGLEMML